MNLKKCIAGWVGMLCLLAGGVQAAEWHVATNGNDGADGTTWPTAKLTIQAGVDAASDGDTVWVSNGVYATGGRAYSIDYPLTNRVLIAGKQCLVKSVNGPTVTTIQGAADPISGGLGNGAIRPVWIESTLSGFTLTGGWTASESNSGFAGGARGGGILENCIVRDNNAYDSGGGAYEMTVLNCHIIGNHAGNTGGGASGGTLYNCLINNDNASNAGGGADGSTLYNCTVVNNWTYLMGGGIHSGTVVNSIVYWNVTANGLYSNYSDNPNFSYSCTSPDPGGTGNVTNYPQWIDGWFEKYRLAKGSPCIDSGNDAAPHTLTDFPGNPRIVGSAIDMGAYEWVMGTEPTQTNIGYHAQTGICIEVTSAVSWTASTNAPWLSITSGHSGATNGTIVFNVTSNSPGGARTGTVTVAISDTSADVTVIQEGYPPILEIEPSYMQFDGDPATNQTISVTGNVVWTVMTNGAWFSLHSATSGVGEGTIYFDIDGNAGFSTRTGMIIAAGGGLSRTCLVTQTAAPLVIYPTNMNVGYAASSGHVLNVENDASWTLETNTSWLSIASGESGTSNGIVVFDADANAGAEARTGTVIVVDDWLARTCTVVQSYSGQSVGSYEEWAAGITNGLTNAADCAAGDGIPNLLRYSTGSPDPMESDDVSDIMMVKTSLVPVLIFNWNQNASDITLVVEGSDAMIDAVVWRGLATNLNGSWGGASNVSESTSGEPVVVTVTDPVALESNRFLRLKVTRP